MTVCVFFAHRHGLAYWWYRGILCTHCHLLAEWRFGDVFCALCHHPTEGWFGVFSVHCHALSTEIMVWGFLCTHCYGLADWWFRNIHCTHCRGLPERRSWAVFRRPTDCPGLPEWGFRGVLCKYFRQHIPFQEKTLKQERAQLTYILRTGDHSYMYRRYCGLLWLNACLRDCGLLKDERQLFVFWSLQIVVKLCVKS